MAYRADWARALASIRRSARRSYGWFFAIGALAAAAHYEVALIAHHAAGIAPEWANLVGFGCAFPVSYIGHRKRSFRDTTLAHRQSAPRFALVAVTAFAANQLLLMFGLRMLGLPFRFALGAVLVIVAAGTFVLSRYWAFRA